MPALQGKVAIITGGNNEIRLAAAKRFVADGALVFLTGRRQTEMDKAIRELGSDLIAMKADVPNLQDLNRLYKHVGARKGKIDTLFANVGSLKAVKTPPLTPEYFDGAISINARGVYFTAQRAPRPDMNRSGATTRAPRSIFTIPATLLWKHIIPQSPPRFGISWIGS